MLQVKFSKIQEEIGRRAKEKNSSEGGLIWERWMREKKGEERMDHQDEWGHVDEMLSCKQWLRNKSNLTIKKR